MPGILAEGWYRRMVELGSMAEELADEFWEKRGREVRYERMHEIRERRHAGYGAFMALLAEAHPLLLRGHEASQPLAEVEAELHARLGLWLCSYFLGFPLPHLWEGVHHRDYALEGYPGSGAVYDKLAGDLYRAERRYRERHDAERARGRILASAEKHPVLVLAFSPTALLAAEDLPTTPGRDSELGRYQAQVARLAGRYLRLQMWLYFAFDYPIRYTFVVEAAAESLAQLCRRQPPGEADVERMVRERFGLMAGSQSNLFGISRPDLGEFDVWTICSLGVENGALSERPRAADRRLRSHWVQGTFLEVEREKVTRLVFDEHGRPRDTTLVGDEAIRRLIGSVKEMLHQGSAPGTAPDPPGRPSDRSLSG